MKSKQNVNELFSGDVRYIVPTYQRKYTWEEPQWEAMWESVSELVEEDSEIDPPHFTGILVLVKTGGLPDNDFNTYEIVDGQQRLITIQILMHAMQKEMIDRKMNTDAKKMDGLLYSNENLLTDNPPECRFKVCPSIYDRDVFYEVLGGSGENTDHQIANAHEFFRDKVRSWLDADPVNIKNRAKSLCNHMKGSIIFMLFPTDKEHQHAVFNTLNTLGTPLRQSDMAKNFFVDMYCQRKGEMPTEDYLRNNWIIEEEWWEVYLPTLKKTRAEDFMYWWITAIHGSISNERIFESFEEMYYDKYEDNPDAFVYAMREYAHRYREIMDRDRYPEDVGSVLYQLRRKEGLVLKSHSAMPLLLLSSMSDIRDRNGVGGILVAIIFRRLVCNLSPKHLGKMYKEVLAVLRDNDVSDVDIKGEIIRYLNSPNSPPNLVPNRAQIENGLMQKQWKDTESRIILEAFQIYLSTNAGDKTPTSWGELTIEHIIPKKWKRDDWPLERYDDGERRLRDKRIHLLGNLTLTDNNPKLGNKPWRGVKSNKGKRALLEEQQNPLRINVELLQKAGKSWKDTNVDDRTKRMAQWIDDIWTIPKE